MMKKTFLATMVAVALCSTAAKAEVNINGFASIKAGKAGSGDSLYGYTDEIDFKNESLFAVQFQSDLGEKLSVTAQLMARGNNDFDAEFEWAFLTYQLDDAWRLNAGRLRTPFYKYSDFRDVGYAYDWLRTPQSVYDLGFDTIEGVSLYHSGTIRDMQSNIQLVFGAYDGEVTLQGTKAPAQINNIMGASWELSQDWLSVRVAYLVGAVTVDAPVFNPLFNALNGVGLNSIVKAIDFDEDDGSFFGLGMNYDRNDWLMVAEYTHVKVKDTFYANQDSYYVSLGHRFDSLTPYISYEKDEDDAKPEIYAGLPANFPLLLPIASIVMGQEFENTSWNVGMRYDFHPAAAFKVELTSSENNMTNQKDSLIAIGVDLVF
ncbi:porin [Rheinheimera riviphila]|uniref:Porin n=2 Tax=Rheinheimera riviphila TaxID=1834037 RepID=A0A437R5R6_9GAMM|nr:porin [Rheinheimera riviphila]